MTIVQLLSDLHERGVQLLLEGDDLRVRAPRGAVTAELQTRLRESKGELVSFLSRARGAAEPEPDADLLPVPRYGRLRLSFAQRRLWYLDLIQPGNPAYNVPIVARLSGLVRPAVLAHALSEIARRHEPLRTVFPCGPEGEPVQAILPPAPVPLPEIDLSGLSAAREDETRRRTVEEAVRPFDLQQGPLVRAVLLRLAEDEHLLLLCLHHIVFDGWSAGVLLSELSALYPALARGETGRLPELEVQYADFAQWQRRWTESAAFAAELAHWRSRLEGLPQGVDPLPPDRPRPAVQSFRGRLQTRVLPAALAAELRNLGERRHATLFMVLLAGFEALLHRSSWLEDFAVGSAIAGRTQPRLEGLIGFFVNTLALRADLSGDPSFRELLDRVRDSTFEAYAHQGVPFDRLVEELRPERSPGRNPLFQVLFVLQNAPLPRLDLAGVALAVQDVDGGTAKFDLTLSVQEVGAELITRWEHSSDLYHATTVARLAERYERLLAAAVQDSGRRITAVPLESPAERHQILAEWNDVRADYPGQAGLSELFERRAAEGPARPALVSDEITLTYAELNARANRVAHHLRRRGVGLEARVGLFLDRSAEAVVGMLGILKAGGAYVPLDPALPHERLAFMAGETGMSMVLTRSSLRAALPPGGFEVLCLDGDQPEDAVRTAGNPVCPAGGDNLAYVMYTSGSTGQPKGVAVRQRGVSRLVLGANYLALGPQEALLQLAPLSFDAATLEIWGALLNGGRVVIHPPGAPDLEALARVVGERGITTLWLTAGLFHPLVDTALPDLRRVRQLLAGGDVLSPAHVRRVLEAPGGGRLINGYGPTECTTFTCCHPMERVDWDCASVPIGRPISNTSVYLLDRGLDPVPLGVAGELYVGGDGLARGYLHRPDLTAERFLPSPFPGEPGVRLYRTGDLARHLPDGRIEFLGRIDQQVKIRGFRIEPGEVEAALAECPGVLSAVVAVREDGPGDKRLVAYVVPRPDADVQPHELHRQLRSRLPEFMVPAAYVLLPELPLGPTGKVDRRALPAPGREELATSSYAAPRTALEERLAAVWSEVLGLERIGVHDNFFAVGGHSLMAARLVSRVRQALGVDLALSSLLTSPTIAELAGLLEVREGDRPADRIPAAPRVGPGPLSFAQQRLWFLHQLDPATATYNMPAAARLRGKLQPAALAAGLERIAERHESLRTTFIVIDGEPLQVVSRAAGPGLPLVDLSALPPARRETESRGLLSRESARPFDLVRGPLLRTLLLRLDGAHHLFFWNIHHIVSDGWSMAIFLRELVALYGAAVTGEGAALPDLPVQYADFAGWQREERQRVALADQLAYWRRQLAGLGDGFHLPTDRPRPAVQAFRGETVELLLSQELTQALQALGRAEEATPFMILLAGVSTLLGRHSGDADIVVGAPVAGRARPEIEPLIGCFLNTLVLRTDVSGRPSFRELLRRVREVALSALANQDLPFERLLEETGLRRDLSRTPFFQVFLNVLNHSFDEIELPGLRLNIEPSPWVASKFDLTLYVAERAGRLSFAFVYNADLFEEPTVRTFADQLAGLLEQAAAAPDRGIDCLTLVTPATRNLLPDPAAALQAGWTGSVHDAFAAVARRWPDRIAVVDEDGSWTYGELAARVERLARCLSAHGARRGEVVAIYAARSAALPWAVLGVLQAGAAFLILDPSYPAPRLAQYARLAGPTAWLQIEAAGPLPDELAAVMAAAPPRCRLALPRHGLPEALAETAVDGPGIETAPETVPGDLAYVVFTSGSTGVPKGILGEHGPLPHFLAWQRETFGLDASDRFSLLSGLGHDPLLRDLLAPLTSGAMLCVPPADIVREPRPLFDWMARQGITVAHLTPGLAQLLAAGARDDVALKSLRWAFFGASALKCRDIDLFRRLAPDARCVNFYGATETPQAVAWFALADADARIPQGRETVPVGRGIRDVQVLVLNAAGERAGIGERGEIYVRTPHLARGYLGDKALTCERFVANPFTGDPADRMYRTGDLGRYLTDGSVEFLGRDDAQVNLRGYRVELGEIEAALQRLDGIREAVVLLPPPEQRLVAYLVPADGVRLLAEEVRARLQRELPEAMVPWAFVFLEALPLTPNGKIDRRALASIAPDERPDPAARAAAPRTPAEEVVASIWAAVLGVERIGAHDDFFALGGHSLLATRVSARVREAFKVELPVRTLFERPTVEVLAAWIESQRRSAAGTVAPALEPVPRTDALPLSFAQERLWFLEQLQPGTPVYNIPMALRLRGPFRPDRLERSLEELVRRHEALRTTFQEAAGTSVQVIAPPGRMPLAVIDLSRLAPEEREQETRDRMRTEARRPFDLGRGPLLRAQVLRLAESEHVVLLTMHHIISDAWSMGILVREVSALHGALAAGRSPELPELPVQYADYASWQRRWLAGEVLESELAYWRRQLAGLPPILDLPTDRPRPPIQSYRGAHLLFELPEELVAGIGRLAREQGATPFMVTLAALSVLLQRYSRAQDIAVGTPIAGRSQAATEGLIGLFVNTLVLRADLSGEPSFAGLVSRLREVALEAHAHQDVPFERLVEALEPQRSLSHSPLFQVMLAFQNVPWSRAEVAGLELEPLVPESGTAKVDLTLTLASNDGSGNSLVGSFEYCTDLFDRSTVARLAGQFQRLLTSGLAAPESVVSHLPLLGESERGQIFREWNDTDWQTATGFCIHELIEAQTRRTPEAVAVEIGDRSLLYRELDRQANRWAHFLRSQGVGPEVRVGFCVERSLEMMVGLLAILKAGGAYVPLDPSHPAERLAHILEDAGVRLLLTQERFLAALPPVAAPVVFMDRAPIADGTADMDRAPRSGCRPENLAYLIYTSGSTGRPKGVMIPHCAILNRLLWMQDPLSLKPDDRVAQKTPITFDPSVWELFEPLMIGACVVLAEPGGHQDSAYLAQMVAERGVTVLQVEPAMFDVLLDEPRLAECRSLRWVFCGGEALPMESVERFHAIASLGHAELCNLYGPTEVSIDSTFWPCRRDPAAATGATAPIGRPLPNLRAYVLDGELQPVPIGVPGQLFIRGTGLARGYLGRPELTAEKFLPDPFSEEAGARMYATGDLARWLPAGDVEFLGRIDTQVKLRGFRIELDEVESILALHPGVRQAVVLVRESRSGQRLVAYVVAAGEPAPSQAQLQKALGEQLPSYMVPSSFVFLEALPVAVSGKIDRRALAAIEPEEDGDARAGAVPPRDALELRVVRIWEDLLDIRPIGVGDNFFDLGGHSLLAVRLLARLRQELGRELPLNILFQHPTVEGLAGALRQRAPASRGPALVEIQGRGPGRPFFCVHPVDGNVLCYLGLARHLGTERPFYGLQVPDWDGRPPAERIEDLAAHYLEAMRLAQPEGPYLIGGWSMGGLIAVEMARQLLALGQEVAFLGLIDTSAPAETGSPAPGDADLALALAFDLAAIAGLELPGEARDLPPPDPTVPGWLHRLFQQLGTSESLPPDMDTARFEALFETFRTNMRASAAYALRDYPGRIHLFRAAAERSSRDLDLGWAGIARGGLVLFEVPGDHYSLLQEPNVQQLAEKVRESMTREERRDDILSYS